MVLLANELKFLAMDEEQSSIVIFELDRGSDTNLYLWVNVDSDQVRVTTITGIYSYMNHTASSLYVKESNKNLIDSALSFLSLVPPEKINEDIRKCLRDVDAVCESRPGWAEEIEEMERNASKEVEEARNSESGLWG